MFKKMNVIEKVAFIATMLVVVFITTCTNIPEVIQDKIIGKESEYTFYVFDENNIEYSGVNIKLPYEIGKDIEVCHLWPVNEMLEGGQYWEYEPNLHQWIGCF